MKRRLILSLLPLSFFSACASPGTGDGGAFHLGLPHIAIPHLGAPEIYRGQLEKSAESGRPVQLWGDTSLTTSCEIAGETRLEIETPPSNGEVTIKPGRLYAIYPQGDRREGCSGRLENGILAIYTANSGYVGPDQVVLRGTTAEGEVRVVVVDIAVHPAALVSLKSKLSAVPAAQALAAPPTEPEALPTASRRMPPMLRPSDPPPTVFQTPYPN